MLPSIFASTLVLAFATPVPNCSEPEPTEEYHLSNVCASWLNGASAYSATMRASLVPRPASQQVMIYRIDGKWRMRISGYSWSVGGLVITRRNEIDISEADANLVTRRMTETVITGLSDLPFYGSEDAICTDGATYSVEMAQNGMRRSADQHSCAGKTEINEIAALFRNLAVKYDPEFEGLLSGLND